MLDISTISTQQKLLNRKPRVKVDFAPFDYPDAPSIVRFNQYDWQYVHHNAQAGSASACCASDGSFIITDGTTIVRFATPSLDTDWSTWQASGTVPEIPVYPSTYKLIASPVDGEVMLFRVKAGGTTIEYNRSTDYGVSFAGYVDIPTDPYTGTAQVTACYKSNGDIAVMGYSATSPIRLSFNKRISGTWYTTGGSNGWTYYTTGSGALVCDMVFEDDYFCIYTQSGAIKYIIYGDGVEVADRAVSTPAVILLSNVDTEINSFSDVTQFNQPDRVAEWWQAGLTVPNCWGSGRIKVRDPSMVIPYGESPLLKQLRYTGEKPSGTQRQYSGEYFSTVIVSSLHAYLCKIPGFPIILSNCDTEDMYFLKRRGDTDMTSGVFNDAFKIINPHSLAMSANSTYIFGYNGNQIYMSPIPTYWSQPAAGTGMGANRSITTTTERIMSMGESNLGNYQPATLDIILDNHDAYYDSKGIVKGDIVRLYEGFDISGTPTYIESNRYVVDYTGFKREPSERFFVVHCVDAWQKLEDYIFPVQVNFNQYTDDYDIYEILKMLCESTGGSLTYSSRSADITSIHPVVLVRAGTSAASLARGLLGLVPDVIKFNGLAGTILLPATDDSSVYTYEFPVASDGTHPIHLRPAYRNTESFDTNITVIGRGRDGDLVFGKHGSGHISLSYTDSMVCTRAIANDVAETIEHKQRLTSQLGSIIIPSNAGTELWDVITVDDTCLLNGTATKYRIGGYNTTFDEGLKQTLFLVGV